MKDERGNAAVELVLLAPVLLLLIALIVGTGRLFTTKSALESVAREAARHGSQESSASAAVEEGEKRAVEVAEGLDIDTSRLSVTFDTGDFERGSPLVVRTTYDVRLADLPGFGLLPGLFTVEAQHVEIIERYKSR